MGGAIFYKNKGGMNVLPYNQATTLPIEMNLLDALEAENLVSIITDIQINLRDTNQFFMSFDDKIHHYHFGKGLGSIAVQGLILPNCDGELPGVDRLFQNIGLMRGTDHELSIANTTFTVVFVDSTITYSGDPMTNAVFQINFAVIDHSLPTTTNLNKLC
jgi:hypothetical protein